MSFLIKKLLKTNKMKAHNFMISKYLHIICLMSFVSITTAQITVESRPLGATIDEELICVNGNGYTLSVYVVARKNADIHVATVMIEGEVVPVDVIKLIHNDLGTIIEYEYRISVPKKLSKYPAIGGVLVVPISFEYLDPRLDEPIEINTTVPFSFCSGAWNPGQEEFKSDHESQKVNGSSFYPNPVQDQLTVNLKLEDEQLLSLKIYRLDGKLVQSSDYKYQNITNQIYRENINLGDLESGAYLIKIKTTKSTITNRIIKQ